MPDINQLNPSPWLKPQHLLDADGDAVEYDAIIDGVEVEEFKDKDGNVERKAVMSFRGWSKRLTMNKTNLEQIASITGKTNTDDWSGTPVTMFVQPRVFGDKDGIRFKNRQPDPAAAADAPVPAACIPLD